MPLLSGLADRHPVLAEFFPDYAEAVSDVLRARGVTTGMLARMPAPTATACIAAACDAVLKHELCEDGCSSRALELANRLLSLERG
jgi:hypothetical protein